MTANKNKGWTFTFGVYIGLSPDKDLNVRVVILGEVGDVSLNTWDILKDKALYYEDEAHAQIIARDAVADKYDMPLDRIQWVETSDYHPNDLQGLMRVDIGVHI